MHFFGEIYDNKLYLTELGKYADECVRKISELHEGISVPAYQVMPNHIHILIVIRDLQDYGGGKPLQPGGMQRVEAFKDNEKQRDEISTKMRDISLMTGKLSRMIAQMKRAVSAYANCNNIPFAWQPRFYDKVIQDVKELEAVTEYINNNVSRWKEDHFFLTPKSEIEKISGVE